MQKQVDELQSALIKSLRERGQPTVIVKDSGRSGNTLVGVVVVVGGVALYLRFIKGWRLADMMYVTKGALVNMQQSVNTSLATVRGQVEAATNDMLARLGVVSAKADDMLGRQEAMDARLTDVGDRVEGVQGGVALLQDQVAYSNHAVTMLCGAMSEVAKRVGLNGRYVQSLDTLVHGAPPTLGSGRPQQQARVGGVGVRTLLQAPECNCCNTNQHDA
ncbi:hypothetical protein MNEG_10253 [Monoraphidium neglectum]|uniref:DUF1664 domain-containing protein n=1 Tax=Monoraphidium neglectum TaxID=145388 RepID=A0A0D2KQ53_9CHLO|nr:hypothetical protein MNEG_10253 [Monoraphidium neglectum]KIY97708.1 hypothetical protein MNEG_10253 [Monoraphidium neglectum]|eukprot:XP_013896728.1 hypothetical protein MNEG_10253 [Monoraphidium neglectum]